MDEYARKKRSEMGAVLDLGTVTPEAERTCICCYGKNEPRLVASLAVLFVVLEPARVGGKHSSTPLIPSWNQTFLAVRRSLEPNRHNIPPTPNTTGSVIRRQPR